MSDTSKNTVTPDDQQAANAKAPHEAKPLSPDDLASVTGGKTVPQDPSNSGGGFIPRTGVDPRVI